MKASLKLGIILAVIVSGVYVYSFYNSTQTIEKKWFGVIELNPQMEQDCEQALIDSLLSDTENPQIATWMNDNCKEYLTLEKKQEVANKIQSQYLEN